MTEALDRAARDCGGRVIAAIAARFRDLDLAEDAFGDACLKAATAWADNPPRDAAAWLYRVAERAAIDRLRRRHHTDLAVEPIADEPSPEEVLMDDSVLIPDERLRLIFVCCHPAIHPEARAALTLRLVCGLTTAEIARAFLLSEPTLAQRLVRAKHKIAAAGIAFEAPGPTHWPARLEAVMTTIDIAYGRAHADAAGSGRHAGYAAEMLDITATLAAMMPDEADVLAMAATVRFAEARRSARVDGAGMMVPLADQNPADWDHRLIDAARPLLARALAIDPARPRVLMALIHGEWGARPSLAAPPPWRAVLTIYDALLAVRDDAITRLNRAVALAEVAGPAAALEEVDALAARGLADFLPYHAVRADLLARLGFRDGAEAAYDAALALQPDEAEAKWLRHRRDGMRASKPIA